MTEILTCWTCDTDEFTDLELRGYIREWFTYEVDGVTYVGCMDCAIKHDELTLRADVVTFTDQTACTLIR